MIAESQENEANAETPLPNSRKVYVGGLLYPDLRVPFREISLAPTKTVSGEIEVNDPVRVYDTSGPWGDPDFHGDVERGLPPLRANWIRARGDVVQIEGRAVTPIDDGYLSATHAAHANGSSKSQAPSSKEVPNPRLQSFNHAERKPVRARNGNAVTQLAYARRGIITAEMEYIAIRENLGRASAVAAVYDRRNGEMDRRSQSAATE